MGSSLWNKLPLSCVPVISLPDLNTCPHQGINFRRQTFGWALVQVTCKQTKILTATCFLFASESLSKPSELHWKSQTWVLTSIVTSLEMQAPCTLLLAHWFALNLGKTVPSYISNANPWNAVCAFTARILRWRLTPDWGASGIWRSSRMLTAWADPFIRGHWRIYSFHIHCHVVPVTASLYQMWSTIQYCRPLPPTGKSVKWKEALHTYCLLLCQQT